MVTMRERQKAADFFSKLDRPAIVEAIRLAESKGRGEIRVHLHHGRVADSRVAAERVFLSLGMAKTAERTGCLLFIAPEERAFSVIGDRGIHDKVGNDFWLEARDRAASRFAGGRFTEGIVEAVGLLGDALARHFPLVEGSAGVNELSNEVTEDGTDEMS